MRIKHILILIVFISTPLILLSQLNGVYTIDPFQSNFSGNPNGIGGKNYNSFNAAVNALQLYGISGAVWFNISSGTYNEQVSIPNITGSSRMNRITFQSKSTDSTSVILENCATNNTSSHVVLMNGAKYITLKNLTISAKGLLYGKAIIFQNLADYNEIIGCNINVQKASNSDASCIYFNNAYAGNRNFFYNNYFKGGFRCFNMNSYGSTGNKIIRNQILQFSERGIFAYYQDSILISQNTFFSTFTNTMYGISLYSCQQNPKVLQNKIFLYSAYSYGLYYSGNNNCLTANNFISIESNPDIGRCYGVYILNCSGHRFIYNTVNVKAGAPANSYSIYLRCSNSAKPIIYNNIFSNFNNGYAIYNENYLYLPVSDFNNFYTSGPSLAFNKLNLNSFSAWQNATQLDSHSFSIKPHYFSNKNLHINNAELNNKGKKINDINTDIDGQLRNNNPDIGADEFSPANNDVAIIDLFSSSPLEVGNSLLKIKIRNLGDSILKTITLNWEIDGIVQTPVNYIQMNISKNYDTILTLGNYYFEIHKKYNLRIWSLKPNNENDENPNNDTIELYNIRTGLAGEFTIGHDTSDFKDIESAVDELVERGAGGQVVFRILKGIYYTKILLPEVKGTSYNKTVTFESFDKDSTSVELMIIEGSSSNSTYGLKFNGLSYCSFKFLTIRAYNQYCNLIEISGGSRNITLANNRIYGLKNSSRSVIVSTSNSINDSILIEYNLINGGYNCISLSGKSKSDYENGSVIRNNNISGFIYFGIEINNYYYVSIIENSISNHNEHTNNSFNGIYCYNITGSFKISGNIIKLIANSNSNGIYINQCSGSISAGLINNNMISVSYNIITNNKGLRLNNSDFITVIYNSINLHSYQNSSNSASLEINNGSYISLMNNIFCNNSKGYAIISSSLNALIFSDYNNLFSNGTYIGSIGSTKYTNFSSWKSNTYLDFNSKSVIPNFYDIHNLHLTNILLDSMGLSVQWIENDIDHEIRNSWKPDIGADEFFVHNNDLNIIKNESYEICDNVKSPISIKIRNDGRNFINKFRISWLINDTIFNTRLFNNSLNHSSNITIVLDSFIFLKNINYHFKIWIDTLGGWSDENKKNDTLVFNLKTQMSGFYSIGKLQCDFSSFNEAVDELVQYGICGHVTFMVDTGYYYEQIIIPQIKGVSNKNTITFQSVDADSTKAVIDFNSISNYYNFTIQLNGADYIIFRNFTIKGSSNFSSFRTIEVTKGSDYNTFSNNKIIENSTNNYSNKAILTSSDNNLIKSNYISSTYLCIYLQGNSTTAKNNSIINNTIVDFSNTGIYATYQDGIIIESNTIKSIANYGINLQSNYNSGRIMSNIIEIGRYSSSTIGLSVSNAIGTLSNLTLIANNFINVFGYANNQVTGLIVSNCNFTKIFHNTIFISSSVYTANSAVRFSRSKTGNYGSVQFQNNIIYNAGNAYCCYYDDYASQLPYLSVSDFNLYYDNSYPLFYFNKQEIITLFDWSDKTAKDKNSFTDQPLFIKQGDPHLKYPYLYRVINPLSEVRFDIDSNERSIVKPVVGADDVQMFPDDISINLIKPKQYNCSGIMDIILEITCEGKNTVNSAEIEWSLNNKPVQSYKFSTFLSHSNKLEINIGSDTFLADTINTLYVNCIMLNGRADQNNQNDSLVFKNFIVFSTPEISFVSNETVCKNSNAVFKVKGTGENYYWYDNIADQKPVLIDSLFIQTNIQHTKTMYVEAASGRVNMNIKTTRIKGNEITMGNMFSITAKENIIIDSFGLIPVSTEGTQVPIEIYYKKGEFLGFETVSSAWTYLGSDTILSGDKINYVTIPLGNITISKGQTISFYITSTDYDRLLASSKGSDVFQNGDLLINPGIMNFYPFDPYFIKNAVWNGIIHYSKTGACKSERKAGTLTVFQIPLVNLGSDTSLCLNKPLVLDAGTGPGYKYNWYYNSSSQVMSVSQKIFVDSSGIYTVQITDTCGFKASDNLKLNIAKSPVAKFTVNTPSNCKNSNNHQFINQSALNGNTSMYYFWSFGDGDHSLFENPNHNYNYQGNYTASLIVLGDNGCTDTAFYDSIIVLPSPNTNFHINKTEQCDNNNLFKLSNSSYFSDGELKYLWDFGDGYQSQRMNPAHSYKKAGIYQLSLITLADNGCNDTMIKQVFVKESPIIFLGNDTSLKINQPITLYAGKGYDYYFWSEGSNSDSLVVNSSVPNDKQIWVMALMNGCFGGDTIHIRFDSTNNVVDLGFLQSIITYPNPVIDKLYIEIKDQKSNDLQMMLYSAEGKEIFHTTEMTEKNYLDLSKWAKGVYFLKIFNQISEYTTTIIKE